MTNIRKGQLDELVRYGGAVTVTRHKSAPGQPLGSAGRLNGSSSGRGRSFVAAPQPVEPAPAPRAQIQFAPMEFGQDESWADMCAPVVSTPVKLVFGQAEPLTFEPVEMAASERQPEPTLAESAPHESAFAESLLEPDQFESRSKPAELDSEPPAEKSALESSPEEVWPAETSATFLKVLLASTQKRSHGPQSQDEDFHPVPAPTPALTPAPTAVRTRSAASGVPALTRTWEWLKKNQKLTAKKQLRVSDTVGLGDKRFVAILHFEGRKFLIGGGGSSVALLKEVGEGASVSGVFAPLALPGSVE